jgi:hypothetical protein
VIAREPTANRSVAWVEELRARDNFKPCGKQSEDGAVTQDTQRDMFYNTRM